MADVLAHFDHVHASGDGWTARCPAHEDTRSSLSIANGDTQPWVFKCHAGCSLDAILEKAGLTLADVLTHNGTHNGSRRVVAEYDYHDEAGTLLSQAVRFEPKDFRQRRPDGAGGWIWNLRGVRHVVYRLPAAARAIRGVRARGRKGR